MNQYKLKKNSPLAGIVAALLTLIVIRFILAIVMLTYEETQRLSVIVLLTAYGIAAVVLIFLLIRMRRSHLLLNDNGIIYTPPFGAVRNLSYRDLQKLSMGGRSYILYTLDGKKLVTFDDFRTDNASEIVAFLKAKGVKAEL